MVEEETAFTPRGGVDPEFVEGLLKQLSGMLISVEINISQGLVRILTPSDTVLMGTFDRVFDRVMEYAAYNESLCKGGEKKRGDEGRGYQ